MTAAAGYVGCSHCECINLEMSSIMSGYKYLSGFAFGMCCAALVGCGGGSSDDDALGTPAPTVSVGTITGFGSVIVNGVRFDDRTAEVTINDRVATAAQLRVGMVVAVEGSIGLPECR